MLIKSAEGETVIMLDKKKINDIVYYVINMLLILVGILKRNNKYSIFTILLIWLLLIVYGCKKTDNYSNALSKENSNAIRGWGAFEIMLGHIGLVTGNVFLFANRKAGILFVGIFFVLSGYGVMYSVKNKKTYLSTFWKIRLNRLCVPFLLVIILAIIQNGKWDFNLLFAGGQWYVWELILLYLVFYLSAKSKWVFEINFAIEILMIIMFYFIGLDNPWYGSTVCFSLGIAYCIYKDRIKNISSVLRRIGGVILTIILGLSMVGFFMFPNQIVGILFCRNIASVSFCMIIILILEKLSLGNKINLFLGKYSYEIFLIHPLIIKEVSKFKCSDYMFCIIVIIATIALAVIIHKICELLSKLLNFAFK